MQSLFLENQLHFFCKYIIRPPIQAAHLHKLVSRVDVYSFIH